MTAKEVAKLRNAKAALNKSPKAIAAKKEEIELVESELMVKRVEAKGIEDKIRELNKAKQTLLSFAELNDYLKGYINDSHEIIQELKESIKTVKESGEMELFVAASVETHKVLQKSINGINSLAKTGFFNPVVDVDDEDKFIIQIG